MIQPIACRIVFASLLATWLWASEPVQTEPVHNVPVLTVCEALKDLPRYNGKEIVVVGRSIFTFEGGFLSEHCEPDWRVEIQGNRWLSMIYLSVGDSSSEQGAVFEFDEGLLSGKLIELKKSTRLETATGPLADRWIAVFGHLISPETLVPHRPPKGPKTRNIPGNGFGANGSVPAKLVGRASRDLTAKD